MRNRNFYMSATMILTCASLVAGCGAEQAGKESASPATPEKATVTFPLAEQVTLRGFSAKSPQATKNDYNDLGVFKKMQQETNVKIDWVLSPTDSVNEKKNLLFASNDLPDFFIGANVLSNQDIMKYGPQGLLLPLEGMIDKYAPNASKLFKDRPDLKKAVTAPDGHIYSLPMMFEELNNTSPDTLFINKNWLDKLGLPIPTTTEQYFTTLKAFKDNDMNGNGKKDEIPFSFLYGDPIHGINSLAGSFGYADNETHLAIENGKVLYIPVQKGYKDFANYMNRLQKEGLVDAEAFTHKVNVYRAKLQSKEPIVGSYFLWSQTSLFGTKDTGYVPVPPLKGPEGKQQWQKAPVKLVIGGFAATTASKKPEIALQWFDKIYDPKTSMEHFWGPFGKNIKENSDGTYEIIKAPAGVTPGAFRHEEAPGTTGTVMLLKETLAKGKWESDVTWLEKREQMTMYQPFQPKEIYPSVLMTQADTEKVEMLGGDIGTYVKDTLAKWIIDGNVDAQWDAYISQLNKMGIEEMVKIYQKYYDSSKK
jgi:putative aldouronate transport system substrate-binding protein